MTNTKLIWLACIVVLLQSNVVKAQWVQTSGPNGGSIRVLAVIGTNLFVGTVGGVYLSTDNGTTWTALNSGLEYPGYPTLDVSSLVVSGTNLFAGTHWGIYGVSFSVNTPSIWTPVNGGLTSPIIPALAVYPNGTGGANLFAGTTTGGVLLSTNSGGNWTPVNHGLTTTFIYSLAVVSNGAGTTNLFAGTKGGGVFRTTDDGSHWVVVDTGLTNKYITTLVVDGSNLFAGALNGDILRTTDYGANWTPCSIRGLLCGAVVDTNLFVGTTSGIFLSTDHGTSWTAMNSGLSDTTAVYALTVLGTNIFAGTDQNIVYRRPIAEMTTSVRAAPDRVPTNFVLEQNYPNPFNPSTTIRYGLPVRSTVRLRVFNMLGQVVGELVNGEQRAGSQSVTWNANLASGIYFYRIEVTAVGDPSQHFEQVNKLVFLK
jgi:photosystem II stability/assembly factor-like uncharacterized protein